VPFRLIGRGEARRPDYVAFFWLAFVVRLKPRFSLVERMKKQLVDEWNKRPWWMNLLWFFCLYMTFIYMPFDMFTKPYERWEEIWFGFILTGWPAKLTEPLHWLIYAAGAFGFWKMRSWMWPWAAVYSFQVVIAMVVFNLFEGPGMSDHAKGGGLIGAVISGAIFMIPTVALFRARGLFTQAVEVSKEQAATKEN
jgi:hypothetical protein